MKNLMISAKRQPCYNAAMEQNTDSYSWQRAHALQQHADILSGCPNCYVLVLSAAPVQQPAQDALRKSFAALGYGTDACTYLVATPETAPDVELTTLIEALDPGVLIAADIAARAFLADAYRQEFPACTPVRLFGRRTLGFDSLDGLMESEEGRQKIWATLKTLPKLS